MEALIIAAGEGSRLRSVSPCKPLTPIAGIALLELAVRQLAAAGITRVVVATGYRAELIEAALPRIAEIVGIAVEPVRVHDWKKPNGHSVIAGARHVAGDYLLVMADHLFSASILPALIQFGAPAGGVTLAIDARLVSPLIDPEDATYVARDVRGHIQRIGKRLQGADAVDCGAFYATPGLSRAIAASIASGRPGSLSDGMQRLADQGLAATCTIGDAWWLDVDDPKALALAEANVADRLPEIYLRTAKVASS